MKSSVTLPISPEFLFSHLKFQFSIDNTRWPGRIDLRHSQGFDLQQGDLRIAPEPGLAMNTVNGYKTLAPLEPNNRLRCA